MTEEAEIRRDGAKAQKNSGRHYREKGDAVLHPFLVDYKEYARSYSVSIDAWRKICADAIKARCIPALKLVLGKNNEKVRVWVVEDRMFHEMREAWLKEHDS